jgi:hypothetical protein
MSDIRIEQLFSVTSLHCVSYRNQFTVHLISSQGRLREFRDPGLIIKLAPNNNFFKKKHNIFKL